MAVDSNLGAVVEEQLCPSQETKEEMPRYG